LQPCVTFNAGADALRIRLQRADVLAEFHQTGSSYSSEVFALPLDVLGEFEGRMDGLVALERTGSGIQVRWDDGIPRLVEYELLDLDNLPQFPTPASILHSNDPGLLNALHEAMETTAKENPRYAVDQVLLRGGGEIIATDGRQLLVQKGFDFPWTGDAFVPRTSAFGCRELPPNETVAIGKDGGLVTIRVGVWSFFLPAETEGRFPPVEKVIPAENAITTTWQVSQEDVAFLLKTLPRLPGKDDENSPITVDLDGQALLRARDAGQSRPTEVVLAGSAIIGKAVRLATDRQYLARALEMGFTEFAFTSPDSPVLCRQGNRTYVWMVLSKEQTLQPCEDALRVTSAEGMPVPSPVVPQQQPVPTVSQPVAATTNSTGTHRRKVLTRSVKNDGSNGALLAEAQALKATMREVLALCGQLVWSIRRHRKQARLVQTTLASLRQLQRAG
jgi:hypothetical protein